MERKKLRKLVVPILLVAVLAFALPSAAVSGTAKLSPDETVLLSHLPDQQIGKKYPREIRLISVFLPHCRDPMQGGDSPELPVILSGLMP